MSMAKEMSCWEIMNCQEYSECAVWRNPEMTCWDLAQELKHVQNVLGVCCDCIVFQVKQNPELFGEKKLAAILSHRKVNACSRPKCPAIMIGSLPRHDDRRKARRFKVDGDTLVVVANREDLSGHTFRLVDLSNTGLACVGPEVGGFDKSDFIIDVKVNGCYLKKISGSLISDEVIEDDRVGVMRRYEFKFIDLSSAQCTTLDSLLMEHALID